MHDFNFIFALFFVSVDLVLLGRCYYFFFNVIINVLFIFIYLFYFILFLGLPEHPNIAEFEMVCNNSHSMKPQPVTLLTSLLKNEEEVS